MVQETKSRHPTTDGISPTFTPEEILQQQQRIIDSPEFNATPAQVAFLKFIVDKFIAGESDEIKGYTVATQVFGRNEDFDQNTDPIVSIHANKLRRALERYYLTAGRHDPLLFEIPKGSYIPVFHKLKNISPAETRARPKPENTWPTVLLKPFQNLTGNSETNYIGIGLATEISHVLAGTRDIRLLMYGPDGHGKRASDSSVRFVVEGSVRRDKTKMNISVVLIDANSGIQIFGESHSTDYDGSQRITFQEEFARKIAVKIAGEQGAISRTLHRETKNKPIKEITTYDAILRYYEYNRLLSIETYLNALEALTIASKNDPDCGPVWTSLGHLYADNITLEYFDNEITLAHALSCASKGVILNPDNQRGRTVLALLQMLFDEIPAARAEVERALALNPDSLFFMDAIGYLLTLLGDWERGTGLIKKAISINPYYHNFVHYALWLDLFRKKEYEAAYDESLNFAVTGNFWEPLARAATLGQLGRIKKGTRFAKELLKRKPEFKSQGRKLIKYYIKSEGITERVIAGLQKTGVNVK